jgi:hypothetical protein
MALGTTKNVRLDAARFDPIQAIRLELDDQLTNAFATNWPDCRVRGSSFGFDEKRRGRPRPRQRSQYGQQDRATPLTV